MPIGIRKTGRTMTSDKLNVVVFGGTSAIAEALCLRLAQRIASLTLIARNEEKLSTVVERISRRYSGSIRCVIADLRELGQHVTLVRTVLGGLESVDYIVLAHGVLPDQEELNTDYEQAMELFTLNATAMISLTELCTRHLEGQGHGTIAVLSSVAGERGRKRMIVYSAAKSAVSTYCEGLRLRALDHGVHVVVLKPGVILTPMTQDRIRTPLDSTVERAAKAIDCAMSKRQGVAYIPWFWRPIMAIVRILPEWLFRRLPW